MTGLRQRIIADLIILTLKDANGAWVKGTKLVQFINERVDMIMQVADELYISGEIEREITMVPNDLSGRSYSMVQNKKYRIA